LISPELKSVTSEVAGSSPVVAATLFNVSQLFQWLAAICRQTARARGRLSKHFRPPFAGAGGRMETGHQRGSCCRRTYFPAALPVGRISDPSLQPNGASPVAPSAIRPEGQAWTSEGAKTFVTPRALELREIAQIVEQCGPRQRTQKRPDSTVSNSMVPTAI
jgi:hypothetical protein